MRLPDVEVFHAVMIAGGAGRAAELLGTSQPSVSRSIAQLERSIGFPLFDRVRGRLVPTADGLLFHAEVQRNLVGLDRLRQAAARIREVGAGSLRVASLAALGGVLVPRAVARFGRENPEVRTSLQIRTSSAVRELVVSGQVDLGLAADEIDASGVEVSVFATPRAVCVLPRGHPLAQRQVVHPTDLANERFIALAPDDTVRKAADRIFAAAGVVVRIAVETPFSASVVALVAEGAGVGLANPFSIDRTGGAVGVNTVPFEPAVYFRALLLRSPGAPSSRTIQAFMGVLLEERNRFPL